MSTEIKSNTKYEVLTPNGWSDFSGIKKTYKQGGFIIYAETSDGQLKELGCSDNHRIKLQDGTFKHAIEISLGDVLSQGEVVIDVLPQPDEEIAFYDLLDVSKDEEYYTNDIVSHNCAHINENVVTELWLSTSPALSCIVGNTLLLTEKGFVKIEDVCEGKEVGDYFELNNFNVFGMNGIENASHGYVSPESDTKIITTRHGFEVEVTENHPLWSVQNGSEPKMIKAKDLKEGDFLRVQYNMNCFGTIDIPEDLAYMLGGYTAEGWITKSIDKRNGVLGEKIQVSNTDKEFIDVFLRNDFKPDTYNKNRFFSAKKTIKTFEDLGVIAENKASKKEVPFSILQGTKKTVTNFLSGLFDGDGSVVLNKGIIYYSTSKILVQQVQQLLLNLGIISNIVPDNLELRKKDVGKRIMPSGKVLQSLQQGYYLLIPRSQTKQFVEHIGFRIKRKQIKALEIINTFTQEDCKIHLIPFDVIEQTVFSLIRESRKPERFFREKKCRIDKAKNKKTKRYVTKQWLSNFINVCDSLNLNVASIKEIAAENYLWVPIKSIVKSTNKTYDLTVPGSHSFLQNCILGSNTGGQAIIISTPKGQDNLFYRIWSDALEKKNTFYTIELPWTVHPERDEEWFKREAASVRAAKGEWGVRQEFFCTFIASGDTFINTDVLLSLEKSVCAPLRRHSSHLEILIWEEPIPDNNYLLTADVSSGTAEDFSTFCLLNLNTGNVAADFKAKILPQDFTPILIELGHYYNNAYLCPEKNSYGLIVSEQLRAAKYPNLYFEKQTSLVAPYQPAINELPGWTTAVSNRADILAKLDVMLSTGKFKINSTRFVDELKNFVWKNNKPQAKKGKNDDLVMAYAIAAILYFSIDAELEAPKKDENPPIEVSTLQAMLASISSKTSRLSLEQKRMISSDEVKTPDDSFRWIY